MTKEMSRDGVPTICWVIPYFQVLKTHLKGLLSTTNLSENVKAAVLKGLVLLEKYYDYAKDNQNCILGTGRFLNIAVTQNLD